MQGRFIVLDGMDGSGKSTQARRLAEYLQERGRPVLHRRDPGGTPLGEAIRRLLLDPETASMTPRTELLLYMASRAELVQTSILPALESGTDVVCERYVLSTLIYQGLGFGLDLGPILAVGEFATRHLVPDLTLILDLSAEQARERVTGPADRIESRPDAYQDKVRAGFQKASELVSWEVRHIAAAGTEDEVFQAIREAVDVL